MARITAQKFCELSQQERSILWMKSRGRYRRLLSAAIRLHQKDKEVLA